MNLLYIFSKGKSKQLLTSKQQQVSISTPENYSDKWSNKPVKV